MVATKNITDLNAMVTPQADDLLLIVEKLSATSTEAKKITWANVQEAIQDIVGTLIGNDPATPSTITVTYDDTLGRLTAHVINDTSTQKSRYSKAGALVSTRQEANFINGIGINVDITDNNTNNRSDITVKNTGVVTATNNTVTGTKFEFLSSVTVQPDGSKTLELRPLKLGSNKLEATYSDSSNAITLDVKPENIDINSLSTTTPLGVSVGGTGSSTASGARVNIGAAKSGANSDISSLSNLTTALSVSQGGTGAITADAALKNLSGLNSAAGVGAIGEQIVYNPAVLVSGSYRAEFKGIKPTNNNYITVATDSSDIALGANPNNILDGVSGTRNINAARLTNAATPIASSDLATKGYVDSVTTGLDIKANVVVATTTNLSATYSSIGQTLTGNSNGALTLDGVSLVVGNRVLVKDQTTLTQNGIYTVTTVGSGSAPFVLTRADDYNQSSEITAGSFTFVAAGTANSSKSFVQVTRNVTLDTSNIVFSVFGSSLVGINSIANDKLEQVIEGVLKGRAAGTGTGNVTEVNADQVIGIVNAATSTTINAARLSLPSTADTNARIAVARNTDTTATGTRRRIRFIEGSNVGIVIADDAANEEVDITISAQPLAGGLVNGPLEIGTTGSLSFEGSVSNEFETTLTVEEPTADRIVRLPDASCIVAGTNIAQTYSAAQRGAINTLTDGATITANFAVANNFSVTLAGNRFLANPTNLIAGQSGCIWIIQDGTGNRTLNYDTSWKFTGGVAPNLALAANAVNCLVYAVRPDTKITATLITNLS
jgi:hypothetical protein